MLATTNCCNELAVPAWRLAGYTAPVEGGMDRWAALRRAVVAERERRGWSQQRLADEAGVSRPALSDLETGKTSDPRGATLQKVGTALGWSREHAEALERGEQPDVSQPSPTEPRLARRFLPRASAEVVARYARLMAQAEPYLRELEALEEQYGRRGGPSASQPRGGES